EIQFGMQTAGYGFVATVAARDYCLPQQGSRFHIWSKARPSSNNRHPTNSYSCSPTRTASIQAVHTATPA
ncbi:hypothetical protein, partial [Burkholderia cepacia]|uniref:hypothetical protein n=1 Tax=Burkholderia cepacia TaxID=292 RepID=UPI002AB7627C